VPLPIFVVVVYYMFRINNFIISGSGEAEAGTGEGAAPGIGQFYKCMMLM
jgi:hypothetical protein